MWLPQLARQLATLDQFAGGRLNINIISRDIPGEALDSAPRYQRTREWMQVAAHAAQRRAPRLARRLRRPRLDPPRVHRRRQLPAVLLRWVLPAAKDAAAAEADVFLTWPDTVAAVGETVTEMTALAAERYGRDLLYGLRAHVIVRETEAEARAAADASSRSSTRTPARRSATSRSTPHRSACHARPTCASRHPTTASSRRTCGPASARARSGAGAAIVGDPDQVLAKLHAYQDVGIDAFILSGYPHQRRVRPGRRARAAPDSSTQRSSRASPPTSESDPAGSGRGDQRTLEGPRPNGSARA